MFPYASTEFTLVPRNGLVVILEINFEVGDGKFLQSPRTPTQLGPFVHDEQRDVIRSGILSCYPRRKNKKSLA